MASGRQLLLLSGSKVYGSGYLEWAKADIMSFLKKGNITRLLFVPYALFDYEEYTHKVRKVLSDWGIACDSIHESDDAVKAVKSAEAVFVGGGNTFKLLKTLYDKNLVGTIRDRVFQGDLFYIGSSAGSNVATISINTTNDMPIVYPPTFDAIGLVPFNINPHYVEPDPSSKHQGETRKERIDQYHEYDGTPPVLGLPEGTMLSVSEYTAVIYGLVPAKLFVRGKDPVEYPPGSDVSFLLKADG